MKLLVIGESCLDVYQYGDSVRLCPEAPVPVFNSNNASAFVEGSTFWFTKK